MTDTGKLAVEIWKIEDIKPYAANAKKHPPEQIKNLAKSIAKFGWTQPIIVDADGVIIAGHGRRMAAIEMGLAKVPVVCRRDLTKVEADALRLADNRVASTEYDFDAVQNELKRIFDEGFDLDFTGYEDFELDFLTADHTEMNTDVFVDDIQTAVEAQKSKNKDRAAEIDNLAAPVTDALGFKRVTVAQSRRIRKFMTQIEAETGARGVEALLAHFDEIGYAMEEDIE